MNDYNHPSSTIYTQSSSYFTNPNMASMPATLSWQHSVGNMVSNFIQPIESKLSRWFWQGINTLPQSHFSKDLTKVNYFDKYLWQGIFNERLESLKEQFAFEFTEQQKSLPIQNNVVLTKIDKVKDQIIADLPQDKLVLEDQLIYLQGIVGKYMLSPQSYEKGLDRLKQVVSNNEQYIIIIEKARSGFRSELKKQPALLAECLQGDVLFLIQHHSESSQNSLTPTPLKKILSYYKPLMAHKSYVRHQNWLQECYNTQSLLPPPVIKRHVTTDTPSNERKEEKKTWNRSIRNLWKLLCEHAGKLITLGLATQVTVAQALETHVTQQHSRLRIGLANRSNLLDTLERVNRTFTNNTTLLDFKTLPTPMERWSSTLDNKSARETITFENKGYTNSTEIFTLPFNVSAGSEFDQYMVIKQELKQEILNQFDKINDDLLALIEIFSANVNTELLEAKSNQTMLFRVIRASFPFSQRQNCNVSKDKLVELQNTINDTLSNVNTPRDSNCELNTVNTSSCDELIQLIQCGVNHFKNGFLQATENKILLTSYTKLDNAYNDLHAQFQNMSDKIRQQVSQEYQQILNELIKDFQLLRRLLNSLKVELAQEIEGNCISEIGHGHIKTAVSKFQKLNDFGNGHLLHYIIDQAYTNYGQLNNFDNIINFIAQLPWFSDRVISYEALYDKMEKKSPKILIFVSQIEQAIGNQYMLKNEPIFVSRLNNLKSRAMIYFNNIIDAWAYKMRNNDAKEIMEFAKKYDCDTKKSILALVREREYASD
ncbi:uncharacterized protein LOC109541276 [Dendroctonus ponderosae]|uniref:uncharacterized protein LOC125502331 n=2 Tax=Dendroctonus ponderosae TaxID=77166 RepID=UPI002035B308|nr:uncharacterized protein LOC125502331 [Dendroctonus ponderosae]XP_048521963.1 uncharacterized protein LOC125502331 [Dendroctonus ponderosae]XP_048521965.1 uncharacterized protein LOC109541276 [Dendroctonus ponderosae]